MTTSVHKEVSPAEWIVTKQDSDLAGRIASSEDAVGLVTDYTYGTTTAAGLKVTVDNPDGTQRITEYYRDGRVKQISGDSVVGQFYEYGVDSTTVYTYTSAHSPPTNSPRWVKTNYD